ncbi:VapB protein (antitoxin to VapC) [Candidatus Burkholderia pumila]|uniref:VapB protein (Antitoxin to VapC) n=1 Tax=Candidatus Burkholderia pumila TaxID=1090375 RepID=A0ABR5HNL6_9BURK|nr:VapB protein (antitoxin to VapC) [Candidatus Burkholderia pumila]
MAAVTIPDIDEQLEARLRRKVALHGRSMEDEARDILRSAPSTEPASGRTLVDSIRNRIVPIGGIELDLPSRDGIREPSGLGE